jgi:hypothetical protein
MVDWLGWLDVVRCGALRSDTPSISLCLLHAMVLYGCMMWIWESSFSGHSLDCTFFLDRVNECLFNDLKFWIESGPSVMLKIWEYVDKSKVE